MKTRGKNPAAGKKHWRSLLWAGMLAFICLWASACDRPEPTGQAAKFAEVVDGYIKHLSPKLIPSMKGCDKGKLETALREIFGQASRDGDSLPFALALLDKNGVYICGHYQEKGKPGGEADEPSGRQSYGSYQSVKDCLEKQRVTQVVLYWEREKYYAVCAPLVKDKETLGALILVFGEPMFARYPGFTEKQFTALKLDAYRP